jgi:trk system potassium uptake protein TrkH
MNILFRNLGYILLISTVFRILPIITAIIYGESIIIFIITSLISSLLGLFLIWLGKKQNSFIDSLENLNLPQAFMLVGISLLLLTLIGSITFLPSFNYNFINAYFESISGFTTTGLTVYGSLEGLPKSLLLWRAETQWIGGMGIVIFFLFIISRLYFHGKEETTQIEATSSLYQSQGLSQQLEPSLQKSIKNILLIYSIYTILGIILLYLSGMNLFVSIALSFSGISTGGFIVTESLNVSDIQLIILCSLMLLGSISFIAHNKIFQRKFKEFILSFEKNIFLLFLISGIIITLFVYTDVKVILFELISAFTGTGYSISEISTLPPLFIMIIIIGMLIGGSVASTSGGMKVARVYSFLALIPLIMRRLVSPRHAIIPLKINKKIIEEKDLLIIVVFVTLFFLILFIGTIIFLLLGYGFLDSLFTMSSALGTVGLSTMDLVTVPIVGKVVLMLAMLLGRLEIFPLLILFIRLFRR